MPQLELQSDWQRIAAAVSRGLSVCRVPEPMTVSEWADEHFVCPTESSAIPGRWQTLPYQRGILDMAIGHPDVHTVSFLKSARIGYSSMVRIYVGYCIAHEPRKVLVYLPTETDAQNTMRVEFEPMLRDCAPLSKLIDLTRRGKHNREDRKHFSNGLVLHVLGGKSGRNYRAHTKDVVIYDELDGFDRNVDGEGAPTSLGDARVTLSPFRKSIRGSTPTVQGISQIEESAEQADAMFRRHLPCPACGHLQPLTWGQLKWDDGDPHSVRHQCAACDHGALYGDLAEMDANGRWMTEDGVWMDEAAGVYRDADDNTVAAPSHIAFHLWAAYSCFQPWHELVAEHYAALKASKAGDHMQRQSFVNLRLGETWSQPGTEIEPHWLLTRREVYDQIPEQVMSLVAGCDVQADRLEVEVLGIGDQDETWSVDYQVLYGDTRRAEVWAELDQVLATQWPTIDGAVMQVTALAVDEGYATDTVRAYCAARFNRRVYAIKGYAGASHQLVAKAKRHAVTNMAGVKCYVFPLGVDGLKQLLYSQLLQGAPGPGYQHFPMRYGLEYFEGLTAEKLLTRQRKGQPIQQWERIRPRNEPLDCRVYAMAAHRIANPTGGVNSAVMKNSVPRATARAVAPPAHVVDAANTERRAPKRRSKFLAGHKGRWL